MPAVLNTLLRGRSPLLIHMPHSGTYVPPDLRERMTPIAQTLPDTDWHVPLLYQFALEHDAGLMAATHSRYVIDLNRDPAGKPLYPAADNTELCPSRTFAQDAIYLGGLPLHPDEVDRRRIVYWLPYHEALQVELAAIRADHGHAILLDAHSIISHAPRFFPGRLPDLNLGTADNASCDLSLQDAAYAELSRSARFSTVLNGRFKGGYITRHYGRPADGIHALQLEIAQDAYMDEGPPFPWDLRRALPLIARLEAVVGALLAWRPLTA